MRTMPWELRVPVPERPAVAATSSGDERATETAASPQSTRRPAAVLAATLPALLLLGLCIAGLSDPPDAAASGTGSVSRLHVPTHDPADLRTVPLRR